MVDPTFDRALSAEIVVTEQLRMRVLAATLAVVLVAEEALLLFNHQLLERYTHTTISLWLPLRLIGPFLAYEIGALLALRFRAARGLDLPRLVRYVNVIIETSLPTVLLWSFATHVSASVALGTWPSMLYFIFIVASTLRLDMGLSILTGLVSAIGYLAVALGTLLPVDGMAGPNAAGTDLILASQGTKAGVMLLAGIVAGLVTARLRTKFRRAVEEATSRERVTNLFGQQVSPAVVNRLLDSPAEFDGETREICVMFLDIRNFTANARSRPPEEVVAFLNAAFAFMIDAVDRHHGFINKFLGDGFMAIFGAPLDDPAAARHAVAAARDILAEIDRRGLADAVWPLKIGIGVHIGRAVTGNVGSPRRKEFTAIGDTVNFASRLESLTKKYGGRLLVSDAVVQALGVEAEDAKPLGAVEVPGYAANLHVWQLA